MKELSGDKGPLSTSPGVLLFTTLQAPNIYIKHMREAKFHGGEGGERTNQRTQAGEFKRGRGQARDENINISAA